jgi:VanZ family protein
MRDRALAAPTWALLALFIIYASIGTWTSQGPGIWAPLFVSWADLAQNFLLYIPFGILGVLTLRHRRQSLVAAIVEVSIITAVFSLFAEVIQLYTVERTASLSDVSMAIAGAIAGGLLAEPAAGAANQVTAAVRPSGLFDSSELVVLMSLLAAIVIRAWWPFDPTLDVTTLAARWRALQTNLWWFEAADTVAQGLLYAWVALAVALGTHRLRPLSAAVSGAAAAGAAALVIDAGQLAMGLQPIGLASVAAQAAGALIGSTLFALCRMPSRPL